MTLKNYLLIFGLISALVFTSCSKEDEEDTTSSTPPKIESSKVTSGSIIDIPTSASSANPELNGIAANVNQIGSFIQYLNTIPDDATTNRSTNSGTTYNWSVTSYGTTIEYWYTVEENGANYNITYELAMTFADNPVSSFPRTTFMEGWIAQNGLSGNLTVNYNVFVGDGDFNLNYVYAWNTDAAGTLTVDVEYNIGSSSDYANIQYHAVVYADGHGTASWTYTDGTDNIVWEYEWNTTWTEITWTYTLNGTEDTNQSGSWTWNS